MMNTSEFLSAIFGFLNEATEYAVLRNFDGLPAKNTSRDIDIMIERKSYCEIKPKLLSLVERSGWKIVTYLNSDRLVTWVCGCVDPQGGVELVQFDFFFHTSVFGVRMIGAGEVLKHRKFNGVLYHADRDHEFLDKYLYDRAVGTEYPEKYRSTREAAEHAPAVIEKLSRLFGVSTVAEADRVGGRKLLLRAVRCNLLHRPFGFAADLGLFLYSFLRNYFRSNTGFSIGFTGPDGSGKTTVIDLMIERLGDVFRKAHAYYHFRPTLFGNLGEVAHSAGIKKEVDRNYSDPHRGGKTGVFSSLVRLGYYSLDYLAGYFVKVKSQIRLTRLVIFDRYYTDIICDSRRSRIYLNPVFLYWFGRLFIPSLDYNILLTASTETILARKRELDEAGIRAINERIDFLAGKKGYLKVLNDRRPEDAVRDILTHVFDSQHERNRKRLQK